MQKGPCFRKKICTPSIARRETHYITALDCNGIVLDCFRICSRNLSAATNFDNK